MKKYIKNLSVLFILILGFAFISLKFINDLDNLNNKILNKSFPEIIAIDELHLKTEEMYSSVLRLLNEYESLDNHRENDYKNLVTQLEINLDKYKDLNKDMKSSFVSE